MKLRRMGPLLADHPAVTEEEKCPACYEQFRPGDYVTLIPLGPGLDLESRAKAREGRPYNAVAACVHWGCATGKLDNQE